VLRDDAAPNVRLRLALASASTSIVSNAIFCASMYGEEMHERLINQGRASTSTFDWEPADTYAKACEIAAGIKRREAFEKAVQTDCDLCHPERQR
jgi:hypothetical protein